MDDAMIIDLYWARDERAIAQTSTKYGSYLRAIARGIVGGPDDVEECVNDTYLGAWGAMPSARPVLLKAFVGKICRNVSLKRWRASAAQRRGGDVVTLSLDELGECVACLPSAEHDALRATEAHELTRLLDAFLLGLPRESRQVFVCRYWHFDTVSAIAERFGVTESKVKMTLKRTRDALAVYLRQEGVVL